MTEHESLLAEGWAVHKWKTGGGYGNQAKGESQGKKNRLKEALFFSPGCVAKTTESKGIFEE